MNNFAISRRVAAATAAFDCIRVELPDQRRLAAVLHEMRFTGNLLPPGKPRPGMIVSLPSRSGKTASAERAAREAAEEMGLPADRGPIRIVTLDTMGTVKSLWSSILECLGDPHFASGHETLLRKRVRAAIINEVIQLLIIDEFNHAAEKTQVRQIVNSIKNLLGAGWVPVAVFGTSDELDALPANPSFAGRMIKSPGLPPRVWGHAGSEGTWKEFLRGLDEGLMEAKIMDERSRLDEEDVARAMCELCEGLVGRAHWVVGEALKDAVRRGRPSISLPDLARNGDALLIALERPGAPNPLQALRG